MRPFRSYLGLILLALFLYGCGTSKISIIPEKPISGENPPEKGSIIKPAELPSIGKWMFDDKQRPAHWLGIPYEGKNLIEPINIIIIDKVSKTPEEAVVSLTNACYKSGFKSRFGHSSGYFGFIEGKYYPQFPKEKDKAYSDSPTEFPNNHGRIFGPFQENSGIIFIGAFSREVIAPSKIPHHFSSFNEARDRFAKMLGTKTDYHVAGFIPLENYILNKKDETTADHDGIAVLIEKN